jgi:hypothetical protein
MTIISYSPPRRRDAEKGNGVLSALCHLSVSVVLFLTDESAPEPEGAKEAENAETHFWCFLGASASRR